MEVPPWLIKGNGTPTTGIIPTTIKILVKRQTIKINAKDDETIFPKLELVFNAIFRHLIRIKRYAKIKINIPKKTGFKINKGEKITFITGGGGGYGDPKNRKQSSIKNDLKQEYLSREYVNEHYNFYIKN